MNSLNSSNSMLQSKHNFPKIWACEKTVLAIGGLTKFAQTERSETIFTKKNLKVLLTLACPQLLRSQLLRPHLLRPQLLRFPVAPSPSCSVHYHSLCTYRVCTHMTQFLLSNSYSLLHTNITYSICMVNIGNTMRKLLEWRDVWQKTINCVLFLVKINHKEHAMLC